MNLKSKLLLTDGEVFKIAAVIYGYHFELKPVFNLWFVENGYDYSTERIYKPDPNYEMAESFVSNYLVADADALVHFKLEWLT